MEAANQQYDGIEVYQPERLARETPTRFPDHALPEVASHPGLSGKSAEKRRPRNLQLDVKTMVILFLVAVIVIGSIIGGVVGSRAAKASPDPSPPTATTSSAPVVPSQPLTRPNIASANWTDAAGYTYRAVFYQGIHNELMINIWHSATLAWRKVNISSLLEPQTSNTQYWYDPPIAGTPLATCVSPLPSGFQLNLYYLSGEGQNKNLRELVTNDITGSTWHLGELSFAPAPLASGSSRIAAYWQTCANCSNILIVLYETPDTSLRANYWTGTGYWTLLGEVRSHIKEGSGLSIAPIVTPAYLADTGTDPMSIKVYYEGSTGIRELIYNKGRWLDGSGGKVTYLPYLLPSRWDSHNADSGFFRGFHWWWIAVLKPGVSLFNFIRAKRLDKCHCSGIVFWRASYSTLAQRTSVGLQEAESDQWPNRQFLSCGHKHGHEGILDGRRSDIRIRNRLHRPVSVDFCINSPIAS